MRISYGAGVVVIILAPFVLFFIAALDIDQTLFLILLLFGCWTVAESFALPNGVDRKMYFVSGVILAFASPSFIIPFSYGIALILVGVIIAAVIAGTTRSDPQRTLRDAS